MTVCMEPGAKVRERTPHDEGMCLSVEGKKERDIDREKEREKREREREERGERENLISN